MLIPVKGYIHLIITCYNQVDIFSHYLNISPEEITYCLFNKKTTCNPMRIDHNPSLAFYMKDDKLRMWDYSRIYWRGDIFEIVGKIIQEDCNIPSGFAIICKDIISNVEYDKSSIQLNAKNIIRDVKSTYKRQKKKFKIEIEKREWKDVDVEFWKSYNISVNFLHRENVIPVQSAYFNDYTYYNFNIYDLCYAHFYMVDKEGDSVYKLYFPYRDKKDRYRTNNTYPFENIKGFTYNKGLVLIKSSKDRLVLRSTLTKYPKLFPKLNEQLDIVSLTSESVTLKKQTLMFLKSKYPLILGHFDRDYTGIALARQLKEYKIDTLFLPKDEQVKDLSDVSKIKGEKEVIHYIKKVINWLNSKT